MKFHYRTISSYEVLPPRWKIVDPSKEYGTPTDRYLKKVDQFLKDAQSRAGYADSNDLVSLVFANQATEHELTSRQLAGLIEERRALNEQHLRDVQWRLDELMKRRPLRSQGPGSYDDASLTEVERQILNLEFQKRALELALWKDTHELRTTLVDERREGETTRRRINYLAGGEYGGV
jgi:hypothetical protein